MKITFATEPETKAYSRRLGIEIDGLPYGVYLYWDEQDGYQTTWYLGSKYTEEPSSIVEMAEENNCSVGYLLEELVDKQKVNA